MLNNKFERVVSKTLPKNETGETLVIIPFYPSNN
jgi:hypothetical protein